MALEDGREAKRERAFSRAARRTGSGYDVRREPTDLGALPGVVCVRLVV
ncbi:hypothetical protein DB31_5217 [Hyalangium minutum]|uniref:Uncharacterized protein n=1 Tax=Hyalangium minutum TaxID=394096 RepID=A0A085WR62_9BACT|nr:hypothetical protein DB31_5217 [Hyalangium minutum]